jgi:hypothetical protein
MNHNLRLNERSLSPLNIWVVIGCKRADFTLELQPFSCGIFLEVRPPDIQSCLVVRAVGLCGRRASGERCGADSLSENV